VSSAPAATDTIRALAPPPNQAIVDRLEELLASARRGEVVGFAYVALSQDSDLCEYDVTGNVSAYRIIGMLEALKHFVLGRLANHNGG
jgi:hypothetical protein